MQTAAKICYLVGSPNNTHCIILRWIFHYFFFFIFRKASKVLLFFSVRSVLTPNAYDYSLRRRLLWLLLSTKRTQSHAHVDFLSAASFQLLRLLLAKQLMWCVEIHDLERWEFNRLSFSLICDCNLSWICFHFSVDTRRLSTNTNERLWMILQMKWPDSNFTR